MQAGRLRHRITIEQVAETRDSFGGISESWAALVSRLPAEVRELVGREFFDSVTVQPAITHRVRIRYRSGLTPKMRVVWGTRTLLLESVIDPDGRRAELHLMCVELL